ncbi:glycosyltransferase family 9 protein [bacterium]|nr:glycosyltransferase family 9 protein [bacterium]
MATKRALIVRLSSLGDVIFNLPLANILKSNGYEVTWITSEKGIDIVKNNPAVDEAILAPLKKWKQQSFFKNLKEYLEIIKYIRSKKFDISIDSQGLIKSFIWNAFSGAKRRIVSISGREFSFLGGNEIIEKMSTDYNNHAIKNYLKFAKHLNLDISEIKAELPPATEKCVSKINNLLKDISKSKPIIGIAPATTWVPKHWNKDNWRNLIEKLEQDYTLIFTGTPADQELIQYISQNKHLNLAGQTSVLELAEVFRRCDLIISLDSGSTHLAWASNLPKIVSIFCCTPTGLYAPMGEKNKYIALTGNLDCQPCHKRKCPLKENQNACTLNPSVEEVFNAVQTLLASPENK